MAPRTREELLAYGVMAPAMADELKANPIRDPQPSDPYYGRNDLFAAREHRATHLREKHHLRYIPGPIPDEVSEEDRKVAVRDGAEVTVRIYRPLKPPPPGAGAGSGSPLVIMYHEGGWCMGDLTDEEVNCRLFAREFGAVCVNVDYRLAPEHKFPTGVNDCWDALQWGADEANDAHQAAENAAAIGADPSRGFIVGGGSAGGNLAAVMAHVARDEGLSPPLTGQYLCVPAVACLMSPDEMPERYRGEYLSHPAVAPGPEGGADPDPVLRIANPRDPGAPFNGPLRPDAASPLFAPVRFGLAGPAGPAGHRGLPPAYLQVCGLDPLRDEALIYERVLREEAGVDTRLDIYPGYGHYFWSNWPRLPMSRKFVEDTARGIRWLLEKTP